MEMLFVLGIPIFYSEKPSNKMINNFFLTLVIFFLWAFVPLSAQVSYEKLENLENFPEFEFIIHDRNPKNVNWENIKLFEISDTLEHNINVLSAKQLEKNELVNSNKCVIILFEALNHEERKEQVYTFHNALLESISEFTNPGDLIKICKFSLKNQQGSILSDINESFTDDVTLLIDGLNNINIENNAFNNKPVSDIYGAGLEAIEILNDIKTNLTKSILILSEERNNKYANQKSSTQLISSAKEKGIVINTIKYNRSNYFQYSDPTLANFTFGEQIILPSSSGDISSVNYEKSEKAVEAITSIINNTNLRAQGNKYLIKSKLINQKKNGASNNLYFMTDNNEKVFFSFDSPGSFIGYHFKNNTLESVISSIILLLILFLIIRFIKIKFKKRKELIAANIKSQKDAQEKIIGQNEEIQKLLEKQSKQKELEKRDQRIKNQQLKEKDLINQMLNRGQFAILKSDSFDHENYEINKPVVSIGRATSNFITVNNSNISQKHCEIVFEENNYKIIDHKSTNGVLVNGLKVQEKILKNGDVISLADVEIKFYL